jgi:hypothetical protein
MSFVSAIGVFMLPAGALLALLLSGRSQVWEPLGLLEGAGLAGAVIGILNLNSGRPCTSHSLQLTAGQTSASCGGFDGTPWLIAGLTVMTVALLAFWWLNDPRRRARRLRPI